MEKYWWQEDKKSDSSEEKYWWQEDNTPSAAETIAGNIYNRVNAWVNNNNKQIYDYQQRHKGRKYSYEDAYIGDSAAYLDTVTKYRDTANAEKQGILDYMNKFGSFLDPQWMKNVEDVLSSGSGSLDSIVTSATSDRDYWDSFGTDAELMEKYGSAENVYGYYQRAYGYEQKYAGKSIDELSAIADQLEDGEERDWLNGYIYTSNQEDLANLDTERAEKGIERLERLLAEYQHLSTFAASYAMNPDAWTGDQIGTKLQDFEELKSLYGSEEEIANLISQNRARLSRAKYLQKGIQLAGVADVNSEYYDPEFKQYSQYVEKDPNQGYVNLFDHIGGGYVGLYDYINGKRAFSYAAPEQDAIKASDYMKPEEREIFNYYYNKYGTDAAMEYFNTILETLNGRKASEIYKKSLEGKRVLEFLYSIPAGLDQFGSGIKNLFNFEDEYIPASTVQQTSGMVRDDLRDVDLKWYDFAEKQWKDKNIFGNSLGQSIYDISTTTANMVPSILASTVVGALNPAAGTAVGAALMGGSAAGNAYQEALNLGYSKGQARAYSTLVGASEAGLQYLMGGIGKLGGMISGKVAANLAAKFDRAFARYAVQFGMKALSEGAEEYLQEILTPVFKNLALGTDEEINLISEDAIYSFLLGTLSSAGMQSVGFSDANQYGIVRQLIEMSSKNKKNVQAQKMYGDSIPELVESGLESPTNTQSYQLAEIAQRKLERGKTLSSYEIRELANANKAQVQAENYSDALPKAEKMLSDMGVKNASKLAKIVAKNASGQQLTKAEKTALVQSEAGVKIAKQLRTEYGTTYEPGEHSAFTVGKEETAAPSTEKFKTSENGKTIYAGNEVSIQGVAGRKNGKLMLTLSNGQTADASQISYGSESEALIYNTVANMDISDRSSGIIINSYLNKDSDISAEEYALGIEEAFRYGQQGIEQSKLADSKYASKLNPGERDVVYRQGQKAAGKNIGERQAALKNREISAQKHYRNFTIEKNGVKYDDVDLSGKKLNKYQRTGIPLAEFLAALGMDVHVFESQVVNGKHVGENGSYYSADGSIHIDLAAGNRGEGLMAYTLSHELTHFIEDWSPAKFKVFANALFAELGKSGANVDKMIQEKLELLRGKKYTKGMTEQQLQDLAYSEVVAECCETMLTDTDVAARIVEKLKAKDHALYNKVKAFFEKLLTKIKGWMAANKAYLDANPDSPIAAEARKTLKNAEALADLFAEAAVDAAEAFRGAKSADAIGLDVDAKTESVAPAILNSERTWTESDYVQEREKAAQEIAKAIGVSVKKAKAYIDSVTSIAKMIAEDRTRLDYFSSPYRSSFVSNVEYGGSFDFSTLCKKRRLLTGTFTAIQKALPNTALTADEILDIRNRMKEKGLEVSCGLCYVEGSRANMGQFAKEFLKLYKQYYPDAWQPNMADVNTPDGIEWVRINHPECYEQYEYFWNHYGTLKPGDKNLFASQQKPKLYQLHTEYKGEILEKFKDDENVEEKNLNGGIRLQSFSDFEIVHLIDTMQIIMDMSRVGLAGQAYTKVPDFAWALGDTGLKINLSLIAKGVDENGKLIFDDVEGMPIKDAMKLRDRYSKNVGTILVAFNDDQLMAAMADDRVDFIIPFHRSQWKKSQYEAMGLPAKTKDYTYMQNEKYIKPQYHEYRGRMVRDKATNYMPNEYWDFSKSGKENAVAYLEMCARNNKRPKFYKLLQDNGDGSYSLKPDGSTDGYWKLLIDFKMYDNDGNGSPQVPVKPDFNMDEATRMLNEYQGGHSSFPVAQGIVDDFVAEYKSSHKGAKFSNRDSANSDTGIGVLYCDRDVTSWDIAWDDDNFSSLKSQMLAHQDEINEMSPVTDVIFDKSKGNNYAVILNDILRTKFGYKIERQDGAKFLFDETAIATIRHYVTTDEGAAAVIAAPYVLKRGKAISGHKNHKNRGYISVTYGAPVTINGERVNVVVSVMFADKNRVHSFHVLMPDGTEFVLKKIKTDPGMEEATPKGGVPSPTGSVSNGKVSHPGKKVKKKSGRSVKMSDRDTSYLDAVNRGDMETAQKMVDEAASEAFKNSVLRDKNGKLIKVYHGSRDKFNVFKGKEIGGVGNYFSPWKSFASGYGDTRAFYVNLTDPAIYDYDWNQTNSTQEDVADGFIYAPEDMEGGIDPNKVGDTEIVVYDSNNIKSADPVTYDDDGNVIPLSERFNTKNDDIRYQERIDDSVSNRSLLANAFESVAQSDIEKQKIREYREQIGHMEEQERKLQELNAKIKELSFASGPRDTARIAQLREEAQKTANRISIYDKKLLKLEASKPLQQVLERERKKAYKRAEQKGKDAMQAYRQAAEQRISNMKAEYQRKRKSAVSEAMESAAKRDAREKLQKLVLDTVKWISYPAKTDVKCPDILKKPYADFLNGIDLSSKRLAGGGDPTKSDLRLANAMGSLATALDKIMISQDPSQDVDKVLDTGYLDLPADFVQKLRDMTENIKEMMIDGDYVVNTMTAAQVRKLSEMIRILNHSIKTMSSLYANHRFANVEALGIDTMEFMDALGEIEKTGGMKDFVQWDNALPYYAFKRFGKGGESIFEGLMDAQDKLAFLAQEIFNFRDKAWTPKEAKAWSEDTHTIDLPNGSTLTLTTADAMSIYCLSRREQGLQHLLGGGTRVMGIQKGSQKAKDSRSLLTIKDIEAINSSLTNRQKQVAESIQEFMSTVCSEWGNEISIKRFLTKEFTEKHYFPIESNDENLPVKDPAAQQSDLFRLLNISATKPLTPGANNEVIIRNIFDVFSGHASDMARLNAYGMGLLDYMKWLNYREKAVNEEKQIKVRGVRKSMQQAYGDAAMGYVLNLVKDVNGRPSDGGEPSILMKWMRAAKTASVGNSLRVATLQITSYPRASLVLSPKNLALGLTKLPNINRAKKYCGIALWKSYGFYDTNISRSIEDQMKGVTDVKQKLIELSLKGAEFGDAITWGCLWNACEYEVASTKQYKVGTEEFYQAVGKKLREVVYRTQVVDSTLTRSQIMRSKRGMAQEAAAFMSEPTLSANILMDAGFEFNMEKRRTGSTKTAWKKTGSYIGRAVAVYSIGQLAAALLESLWDAWRDDEDEEFDEKYLDAFIENLVLDLVPFNKVPIVSDVFEAALSMVGVGFYSSDKMSSTWLTQSVSAVDTWKKVLSGESSATAYNAIYKTARALSSYYGVAFSGILREGVALWNNTAGAYDITWKIRQYEPSKTDLGNALYDAIISGNDRQVESIMAEFRESAKDEKEYNSSVSSAIRKALRENDPRIREAALAQLNGDPSARGKIQAEIVKDGFERIDVFNAIAAEINELKGKQEDTDAPKEKATYTTDDWVQEFVNGDAQAMDEIKADIVDTHQRNGKTAEEASNLFSSSVVSSSKEAYLDGRLDAAQAKKILATHSDLNAEEISDRVTYWDFLLNNPDYKHLPESKVIAYNQYAKPAKISLKVYDEFVNRTKNLTTIYDKWGDVEVSKQDQVIEVIDSLPLTWQQKDALYLAYGYDESGLKKVPW